MLIQENPTLQTAAETLYRLNTDERFRETCERFVRAEDFQNGLKRALAEKEEELAEAKARIAKLTEELSEYQKKVNE